MLQAIHELIPLTLSLPLPLPFPLYLFLSLTALSLGYNYSNCMLGHEAESITLSWVVVVAVAVP